MKKKLFIIIIFIIICILCVLYLLNNFKAYDIRIIIPANSTQAYVYSDEEILAKKNKIIISSGKGLGDTEVILKPIEVKEEINNKGTYLTPGMPIKMEVEKYTWYKIGVRMQNITNKDIVVYVTVRNISLGI